MDISVPKLADPAETNNAKSAEHTKSTTNAQSTTGHSHDGKFAYACDLLSNGLLLMELVDAVREGDGKRSIRVWRYMLLIFKATKCKNYAIEGFILLLQYMYLFSPRMASQLEWNRTVNVHGRGGKNISADLFREHLNRECKDILSGMYSNVKEPSVLRVSHALQPLRCAMLAFDQHNGVPIDSGVHHRTRRKLSSSYLKTLRCLPSPQTGTIKVSQNTTQM